MRAFAFPHSTRRRNRTNRASAFTVIELLVVVAIVAILAAILFPVFAQAKLAAKKTASLSNMKQITTAAIMYAGDNDDGIPHVEYPLPDGSFARANYWDVGHFQAALETYIKNGRAVQNKGNLWWDPADPDRNVPYLWGSYVFNGFLSCVPRNLGSIEQPSATVFQTLRASDWQKVSGIVPPSPAPPAEDPFWSSDWFEMAYDPFDREDPASPYFYTKGNAIPPCSLFPDQSPCDDESEGNVEKLRYAKATLFSFVDGHAKAGTFASTWKALDDNLWDIH